ncbi:hypothetical protein Efla_004344 [Eimeria flavescens]
MGPLNLLPLLLALADSLLPGASWLQPASAASAELSPACSSSHSQGDRQISCLSLHAARLGGGSTALMLPPAVSAPSRPPTFLGLHARLRSSSCRSSSSSSRSSSSSDSSSSTNRTSCSSSNTGLAAAARTGVAVPEDVRDFGRLKIYNWLKPTLTAQQLQQLQQQHEQQQQEEEQQQQQPGGLLGPLSYFYAFDLHLQQVGAEAYYKAAAAAAAEQEAAAREAAREAEITATAKPHHQPPPFSMQVPVGQGPPAAANEPQPGQQRQQQQEEENEEQQQQQEEENEEQQQQQREQQREVGEEQQQQQGEEDEGLEEPAGGGVLLEAWLPGVFPADINVQLSLIGRSRETETIPGVRPPRASPPPDSFWDSLDSDYELDEDFMLKETLAAAERRQAARRQLLLPPPLLPTVILNCPKSTRVLKWEAETFKRRFKEGRAPAYQRYQRAFRLTWPADWLRAEARYDSGRLLVVVPPLPSDAPPPDVFAEQHLFPLAIPVQGPQAAAAAAAALAAAAPAAARAAETLTAVAAAAVLASPRSSCMQCRFASGAAAAAAAAAAAVWGVCVLLLERCVFAAELPTPLPPFPGFRVRSVRSDWTFNFRRLPKLCEGSSCMYTASQQVKLPQATHATTRKPKVRVPTKANWKEA